MTIVAMKREVEELTKSRGEMSKQIGLLIGAMALRGPELARTISEAQNFASVLSLIAKIKIVL